MLIRTRETDNSNIRIDDLFLNTTSLGLIAISEPDDTNPLELDNVDYLQIFDISEEC